MIVRAYECVGFTDVEDQALPSRSGNLGPDVFLIKASRPRTYTILIKHLRTMVRYTQHDVASHQNELTTCEIGFASLVW